MAYELYYSSGTGTLSVSDNAANTQTMLVLPGKDYVGYGSPVDQNQLSMLENYAYYTSDPSRRALLDSKAVRGQIIFDVSDNQLKVNTSSTPGFHNWATIATGPGFTLNTATTTTLGGIKVGSGLAITSDGTLSATGGGGSGSVTSVGLSMPSGFSVGSSPITSSGTLAVSTTLNGIVVANGSGFTTATIGSGLTYTGGTLSATGGGGGTATTYSISAIDGTNSASIRLSGSDGSTDSVLIQGGANVTIDATNDSTIVIAASGGGGGAGFQSAGLTIYRWAATQPALPDYSSEYTWATGALSSVPLDWSSNPPSTSPTPGWSLWAITVRLTAAAGDATTTFNWNTGSIAQISAPGQQGDIYNTAILYQWAPAQPSNPNGTSTWTWSSGSHTSYTGGNSWSVSIPSNPGTAGILLWTAAKEISAAGGTTSTTIIWTDGTVTVSAVGQNGAEGPAGVKTGVAAVYQWSLPPAPSISGTSTFDWSTASVTAAPSGWFVSSTATAAAGSYLYEARVNLTAAATATTTTVNWSGALISIAGYAGSNGDASSAPSSTVAYARVPNFPNPVNATFETTGPTSLPNSNSDVWGPAFNNVWSASDPNPSSTASLYITSGVYSPSTDKITWYTPYLASLRVGNLSAITANTGDLNVTGSITAGNAPNIPAISGTTMIGQGAIIYSTGNFAMGNTGTNISFNGTQLTLNGNVVDTSNIVQSAVTNTASAYSNTPAVPWPPSGTSAIANQVTIVSAGGRLVVWASAIGIPAYDVVNDTYYGPVYELRRVGGGTLVQGQDSPRGGGGQPVAISYSEILPSGTYTYQLVAVGSEDMNTICNSIIVMETKR